MKEENRSKKYTDYHYVSASEYGNATKVSKLSRLKDHENQMPRAQLKIH